MASNRKLPFGYRMERGEIQEHPVEAQAVRDIFRRYLAGISFAALAERLRDAGPAYDGDKPWNKNMVARILENAKYTGSGGFPAVIQAEEFQRVQAQRKSRTAPPLKTPAQKELRRLFGGNPPKYIECQVLGALNRIVSDPGLIQSSALSPEDSPQAKTLSWKLTELLEQAPVDEEAAREAAMDLTVEQLNAIGPEEYETERLRRLFSMMEPQNELDADLLHTSVQRISVQNRQAVIQLKNGQTVKGAI